MYSHRERQAREESEGLLPLSGAQHRLWLFQQAYPASFEYNMIGLLRLQGPLDRSRLARCLHSSVSRHRLLRSVFCGTGALVHRLVLPTFRPDLPLVDLTCEASPTRLETARRLAGEIRRRAFDLQERPPWRILLIRVADERHLLVSVVHHIIFDAASFDVLHGEIVRSYAQRGDGDPDPAATVCAFEDLVSREMAYRRSPAHAESLELWRRWLRGSRSTLALPTDRPRPKNPSFRGGRLWRSLSAASADATRLFSRENRYSLFTVFLAAFEALLVRWSGQDDFNVGTARSARDTDQARDAVGFFVTNFVLRADVAGDPTFRTLLDRIARTVEGALRHRHADLEAVAASVMEERGSGRSPLFPVVFHRLDEPARHWETSDLSIDALDLDIGSAKFDLTLTVLRHRDLLVLRLDYDSELFDHTTLERFGRQLERVVSGSVSHPDRRLSDLAVLARAEHHQTLIEWGNGPLLEPGRSIDDVFRERVAAVPDAIALDDGEIQISYATLDRLTDRYATTLRQRGVGRGRSVGVALERSPALVVTFLGILRAGAAYVPIDLEYPERRIRRILEAADLLGVVARAGARLPSERGAGTADAGSFGTIDPPEMDPPAADEAGFELAPGADGDDLAYVMFTSGSTGRPKGVAVAQRGVVRVALGVEAVDAGHDRSFIQLSPVSFDASTFEIWGALLNGARLVLPPPGVLDLRETERRVQSHRVDVLWLTAGLFHQAVDLVPGLFDGVSRILAGGDVLSTTHVRRLLARRRPDQVLIDGYGPTEATTFTTCHAMTAAGGSDDSVPIGRPIGATLVKLMDAKGHAVPPGVPGELCVGGPGLAHGYLGSGGRTAAKFVPDPHGVGERLYRTGDLARWRTDGRLEYLGRLDRQVKVRGFRIEPAEIELALARHPDVAEAAVVPFSRGDGALLAAYVVPCADRAPTEASLRDHLREALPDPLVPAAYEILTRLPLDANGKLDRRALPEPRRPSEVREEVSGGAATREVILAVWRGVLGSESISSSDDFFALGGHSLLGMKLLVELEDAVGVRLSLRHLFENPTVESLAERVEEALRSGRAARPPSVRRVANRRVFPLSGLQRRLWLLEAVEAGTAVYNVATVLELSGDLDAALFGRCVARVLERHEAFRTVFRRTPDGALQEVRGLSSAPVTAVIGLAELAAERQRAERQVTELVVRRPFDLEGRPLVRSLLLSCGRGTRRWLWICVVHHLVFDGASRDIVLREIGDLYRAGSTRPLVPLAVRYGDFALWQQERASALGSGSSLDYWKRLLQDDQEALELPTDRPRPAQRSLRGAVVRHGLPSGTGRRIIEHARASRSTLYLIALTAFAGLLHRWSRSDRLRIGTPVAGRDRPELEGIVGFFVNTLVLRIETGGDPCQAELLRRVRSVVLGAHAHRDVPFDRLVEALAPDRDPGRSPVFQVAFAVQANPLAPLGELPEVEVRTPSVSTGTAKFDLTLTLVEDADGHHTSIEYATDLFDRSTVVRFAKHFGSLLASGLAHPNRPLSSLPMMTPSESHQIRLEWGGLDQRWPGEGSIARRFADRAREAPDAVAIAGETEAFTYGGLFRRAAAVAQELHRHGVTVEDRVAVSVLRGPQTVVAILGVLFAGAAYVPIDPEYPEERLWLTIEDSGAVHGIIDRPEPESLAGRGLRWTRLDRIDPRPGQEGVGAGPRLVPSGSVAYVIYTSGSTGKPKGVAVTHRNVLRLFDATDRWFRPGRDDTWTLFHSYAFDFSVWEIWGALLYGGRLVIVGSEEAREPEAFRRLLARQRVTVLNQTPSAFVHLAAADARCREEVGPLSDLRLVVFGGEALDSGMLRDWFRGYGAARPHMVNMYGITETTVHVTYRPVTTGDLSTGRSPLGRPIPDLGARIVDPYMRTVPIGVAGELVVGGAGLALGYSGRPSLTASRFVPDAHPRAEAGGRLYRSGDLARRMPDGDIEYLGRIDHQVKIRGYRIELGEIEAALRRHPAVGEAVVVAREIDAGDHRLFAYVVPSASTAAGLLRHTALSKAGRLGERELVELPDGSVAVQMNRSETDFLIREIYERRTYSRHGIAIPDCGVIFDVGANIGLFSLFAARSAQGVRVHAFEPIPPILDVLRVNAELSDGGIVVHPVGLGRSEEEVEFSHYPHASVVSGRYADRDRERETIRSFLAHRSDSEQSRLARQDLDEMLQERLEVEPYVCRVRPLSAALREAGVERIDLLKIDVEKSEEDVLLGIEAEDWRRIRQIVVEVHDEGGRLDRVMRLLTARGFDLVVEEDEELGESTLRSVYARRPRSPVFPGRRRIVAPEDRPWLHPGRAAEELRRALARTLPPHMVPARTIFVPELPRTPSGKLDRGALFAASSERAHSATRYEPPRNELETTLATIFAQVLAVEKVGIHDDFFELGGDSLRVIEAVTRARACGLELTPGLVFRCPSIAALEVARKHVRTTDAEQAPQEGPAPLLPAQRWFFDFDLARPEHWNIPALLTLPSLPRIDQVARAVHRVCEHHDALRLRFRRVDGVWSQFFAPIPESDEGEAAFVDLSSLSEFLRAPALEAAAGRVQESLDLERGPLLRVVLFDLGRTGSRLFAVVHHLVADGYSQSILLQDLETALRQIESGERVTLPRKTTSAKSWGRRLEEMARTGEARDEVDYWRRQPWHRWSPPPVDHEPAPGRWRCARRMTVALGEAESRAFLHGARSGAEGVVEHLVASLARCYGQWTGQDHLLVNMVTLGREDRLFEDTDLSRTVGWFNVLFPLLVEIRPNEEPPALLARVRQQLAAVPRHGIGYGVLRYLCDDPEISSVMRSVPTPAVNLNYLGEAMGGGRAAGSSFPTALEPTGPTHHPDGRLPFTIAVFAHVEEGRLVSRWLYSTEVYEPATLQALGRLWVRAAREIVDAT